jgi:hypothetical protein
MTRQKQIRIAVSVAATLLLLGLAALFFGPTICSSKCSSKAMRVALARATAAHFVASLQLYALDKGSFPPQKAGLAALVKEKFVREETLVDPWGRPWKYVCGSPDCASIVVYSIGDNGIDEGGKGDDISDTAELAAAPPKASK